jgi:hypothetical protein
MTTGYPNLGEADPGHSPLVFFLLFPEKEAKSVSSASQKTTGYPNLGEADPGHSPLVFFLLFPEKEAKSVSSASQKTIGYPNLGEADPGGLGACPRKIRHLYSFFFF